MTVTTSSPVRRIAPLTKTRRLAPKALLTRPTVSVVVPCYNYGRYLEAAVASALDQPGVDVEVIIANNGSTDDSLDIAHRLAARDGRIRVITRPTNISFLRNFNAGLQEATGTYWALLSADDLLPYGALSRATALMEAHPNVGLVFGQCPTFDDIAPTARTTARSWSIWEGTEWIAQIFRTGRNMIRTPEVVMRTSIARELGGFNPDYPTSADMLLWMGAATRADIGRVNGCDQGFYRIHGANLHQNFAEGWLTDLRGLRQVYDTPLDIVSGRVALDELKALSHRTMAMRAIRYAKAAFDAGDRQLAEGYVAFASDAWPPIVRSRHWRGVAARQSSTLPKWRIALANNGRRTRRFVGSKIPARVWV